MQGASMKLNPALPWCTWESTWRKLFTSKLYLNLGKKLVTAGCGTETWTLQTTDQKFLKSPAI
jgi:hypothetical protein